MKQRAMRGLVIDKKRGQEYVRIRFWRQSRRRKDIALISATLGHRDIEMTQRCLGVISEARHDIANTLGELFSGNENERVMGIPATPRVAGAPTTVWRGTQPGENMERAKGIEPSSAAWEAAVLPLNDARKNGPADGN